MGHREFSNPTRADSTRVTAQPPEPDRLVEARCIASRMVDAEIVEAVARVVAQAPPRTADQKYKIERMIARFAAEGAIQHDGAR